MVAPVGEGGGPIWSTRIREALQAGDCATATRLLTRPFTVRGTVQHGDKNGRSNINDFENYGGRSEEHTSELQSLMRISYAVFCLKKKTEIHKKRSDTTRAHSKVNSKLLIANKY